MVGNLDKYIDGILDYYSLPRTQDVAYLIASLGKERWKKFCERYTLYNIETLEFVLGLSTILRHAPKPIIEVCAGRGKLSYWLRFFGIDIIATDDYSWRLSLPRIDVYRLSIEEALSKFQPKTVLGSWIPSNFYLGEKILGYPTVQVFVDISSGVGTHSAWTHDYSFYELSKLARRYGFYLFPLGDLAYFSFSQESLPTDYGIIRNSQVLLFVRKQIVGKIPALG